MQISNKSVCAVVRCCYVMYVCIPDNMCIVCLWFPFSDAFPIDGMRLIVNGKFMLVNESEAVMSLLAYLCVVTCV
jgi:hypothetical protein